MQYDDSVKARVRELLKEGKGIREAARIVGVPYSTAQGWTASFNNLPDKQEKEPDYDALVIADKKLLVAQGQARHFQRLYKAALKNTTNQEALVEAIKDSITPLEFLKPLSVKVPRSKVKGLHSAMPHLTDLHVGEKVDFEAMGGIAEYNVDIFRQELGLWVEKVLYLTELRRTRLEIPEIFIPLDGDVVSGIIHEELERTNEINIMQQASWAAYLLSHAFAQLSQHFEIMRVSCTVGNHGRTKKQKEFKERYVSWDYLVYQMMAMHLKSYPNIQFDIPKAWWQISRVQNTDVLHWHGDGVKGWAGFPWYGIDRAIKELRQTLQPHDLRFDMAIFGHFHVPVMNQGPTGAFYGNGNWKGGDEFAFGALHKSVKPIQNLFFINDEYGEVGYEKIYLDRAKEEHAIYLPKHMPDVWAEINLEA